MPPKNEPVKGDILILNDGRICQLLDDEMDSGRVFKGYAWVRFMDSSETSHVDLARMKFENLGSKPEITFQFLATNSIHVRLNKLSKI